MEKSSAIRIIRQTFQNPFNKDSFVYFIKSLLNHIEPAPFIYRGNFIPDAYKPYVKTLERIGKYQDKDGKKIDLLIVHLKKETSLEYARTRQRNFIAWYLNGSRGNILKDAALVAFVSPNSEDWRFSLVKMDYRLDSSGGKIKVKQELTPARRFSFLVGKNESSHTAQSQLLPILQNDNRNPTLQDLEEAFSIERVTKEFFKRLSDWYAWALDNVQFPKDAEKEKKDQQGRKIALIRFLTRIIFIWFMRQKKLSPDSQKSLIPDYLFGENKLQDILKDFNPQGEESSYYKAILQNLFFATLNTPRDKRRFTIEKRGRKGVNSDYGNHNVYRYQELFKDPNNLKKYFDAIPFLNGGLFECLDIKDREEKNRCYIDGFTRTKKYQPIFPNFLFFSSERRNDERIDKSLNEYYGTKNKRYQVEGLINILKRYNFTIDENSPVDVDVALDPELLGRIFENLLASYNPETATTARKATGSYYTPRKIVHYMVDESLKAYFKTKLGDIRDIDQKLEELFSYETDKHSFNKEETEKLVKAIDEIRVIDPAVGSGAFPMGILQRLVYLLSKLDPENKIWRELQKEKILEKFSGALDIKDKQEREKALKEIDNVFERNTSDYGRKLYLIKNCIYGVDIQPIAIQITKLRFFISLLVDMNSDDIEPLPNLDFKFVAANSLISPPEAEQRGSLFQDKFFSKLQNNIEKYFYLSDYKEKDKARKKIERLIQERIEKEEDNIKRNYIARGRTTNGKKIIGRKEKEIKEADKLIKLWDGYKNIFSHDKPVGFFETKYFFPNIKNGFDIVIANPPYVSVKGIKSEDKKMFSDAFQTGRGRFNLFTLFLEQGHRLLCPNGILTFILPEGLYSNVEYRFIREYLLQNSIILFVNLFSNRVFEAAVDTSVIGLANKQLTENSFPVYQDFKNLNIVLEQSDLKRLPFAIFPVNLTPKSKPIIKKLLSKKFKKLEKILEIQQGIIYSGLPKEKVFSNEKKDQSYKKVLDGRDVLKWKINWGEKAENRFIHYSNKLHRPREERLYLAEEKILIPRKATKISAAYDNEQYYTLNTAYLCLLQNNQFNLKYVLACINSKLINYFYSLLFFGWQVTIPALHIIPIPPINKKEQEPLISLVNKILAITKDANYLENEIKQKQVAEYEKQIDQLVYKLYNLTPEEIELVENYKGK